MMEIFEKYGGLEGLKAIVTALHEEVVAKQEVRHFLFNSNIEQLYKDQVNFMPYILRKSDRMYRENLMQTAPQNVRIGGGQFEEIVQIFKRLLLKEFKVQREDIGRIASHVLELIEESRSQSEDLTQTTWKPVDITAANIDRFYTKSGMMSKIDTNGEISIMSGGSYPFRTRIDVENKQLILIARAYAKDGVTFEQVDEVVQAALQKVPALKYRAVKTDKNPVFVSDYKLPYRHGVPTRLFFRASKLFSGAFSDALECDKEGYLKNLVKAGA
jgi:hypothetical protein